MLCPGGHELSFSALRASRPQLKRDPLGRGATRVGGENRVIAYRITTLAFATLLATGCLTGPDQPAFEIAYRGELGSTGGIIAMTPDGSNGRVLVTPTEGPGCPSFSPDGRKIAFAGSTTNRIAIIDVPSRAETWLTSGWCPTWSPDGAQLAFFRGPISAPNGWGLYVMNIDGTGLRELAPDGFDTGGLDWSPDGRWLAVSTYSEGRLLFVDAATGARRLPSPARVLLGFQPAWAPDGQQVAYVTGAPAQGQEIWLIDISDGTVRQVTHSPTDATPYHNYRPRWSPDGTMIVYWRIGPVTSPGRSDPHIVLVGVDGIERSWKAATPILGDQPFWRRSP